jgi:hypothetical protein
MNQDDNSLTPDPPEEGSPEPELLTVPFEDRSRDFFTGFFETIKLVLLQPTHFFKNYKLDGSIGRPVLFAVIIGWIGMAVSMFWGWVLRRSLFTLLQEHFPEIEGYEFDQLPSGGVWEAMSSAIGLIMAPVWIIIGLFIIAGIYHLFLMMVKGANKNFETTFNVVAYGSVSRIAEILPICGGLIAWVYGIVLAIIGLTEAHRVDSWKAVFAVLVPIALCCICCMLAILVAGGTGFLANLPR